jgi:hypothetical protein
MDGLRFVRRDEHISQMHFVPASAVYLMPYVPLWKLASVTGHIGPMAALV